MYNTVGFTTIEGWVMDIEQKKLRRQIWNNIGMVFKDADLSGNNHHRVDAIAYYYVTLLSIVDVDEDLSILHDAFSV